MLTAFRGALRKVLPGLIKTPVTLASLQKAPPVGGSPATPGELKKRSKQFLSGLSRGKDVGNVSILPEWIPR